MWKRVESIEELAGLKTGTAVRIYPSKIRDKRWYTGVIGNTAEGTVYGCFNGLEGGVPYAERHGYECTWRLYERNLIEGRSLEKWLESTCTEHVEYEPVWVTGLAVFDKDIAMFSVFDKLQNEVFNSMALRSIMPPRISVDAQANKESKMRTYNMTELKKQITEAAKKNAAAEGNPDLAAKVKEVAAKLADRFVKGKCANGVAADNDETIEISKPQIPTAQYDYALLELSLLSGDTVASGDITFDALRLIQSAGNVTTAKMRLVLGVSA